MQLRPHDKQTDADQNVPTLGPALKAQRVCSQRGQGETANQGCRLQPGAENSVPTRTREALDPKLSVQARTGLADPQTTAAADDTVEWDTQQQPDDSQAPTL